MQRTGIILDEHFAKHDPGTGHPESPDRFYAIARRLAENGISANIPLRTATHGELRLVHSEKYLHRVEEDTAMGQFVLSTGDTSICRHSAEVARCAVGSVLNAVDAVMEGRFANAFCAVRPPGHHATPNRGMGFCIYNTIAIAARYAQKQHGIARVLIVDWDVHHGNGTQDTFYEDDSVFFFSTHQHPMYPGTGQAAKIGDGRGIGFTQNHPLPAGSGKKEIFNAFDSALWPRMEEFQPEIILISAGFDSHWGDPLGGFTLEDEDFAEMTRRLLDLADRFASSRVLSVLEGGYHLEHLANSVLAHVLALRG